MFIPVISKYLIQCINVFQNALFGQSSPLSLLAPGCIPGERSNTSFLIYIAALKKLEIYLAPSDCPLSLPSSARPDSIMSSIKNCSAHSSSIALSLMTIAYSLQPPRRERPTPGLRSEIQTHYSKALNRPLLFTS